MPSPAVLSALLTGQGSQLDFHAQKLLNADDFTLFRMLPVFMACIQRNAPTSNNAQILRYLRQFRARVAVCRWLKLRFLLLANHPAFASFWSLRRIYRTNAYQTTSCCPSTDFDNLFRFDSPKTKDQPASSLVRRNATRPLGQVELQSHEMSSTDILRFATNNLFNQENGMRMTEVKHNSHVFRNVFVASVLVDELQRRICRNKRADAVAMAQRFLDMGIIQPIKPVSQTFSDSKRAMYHYLDSPTQDDDPSQRDRVSSGAINLTSNINSGSSTLQSHEGVGHVEIRIPVDMIDLQSFDFWTRGVYLKKPEPGFRYNFCSVTHPLFCVGSSQPPIVQIDRLEDPRGTGLLRMEPDEGPGQGSSTHDNVGQGTVETLQIDTEEVGSTEDLARTRGIVSSMVVDKVFSSIAQPMIVELQTPVEDGDVSDNNQYSTIQPSILVKSGDNLMQDLGVQIMFRCFNHIWEYESTIKSKHGIVPVCVGYEVFPTSTASGFMEAVTNLKSLKEFDWKWWRTHHGGCKRSQDEMLRSTVGSYIGTYVIGGRDRHFDNILIREKMHLLHIDFSYVLGKKPPIDGPAMSIAPEMEIAFRKSGIWDKFVELSLDAFTALRVHAAGLVRMAQLLFVNAGHTDESIRKFMSGRSSLNVHDGNEKAVEYLKRLIERSSRDLGNWFKEFTHERVVPAWFALLDKGFPPAKALMKLRDAQEQGAAARLAASLQAETSNGRGVLIKIDSSLPS